MQKNKLYYIILSDCISTKEETIVTEFVRKACAGTMESSDAYVEAEPCAQGTEIEIESVVKDQFGDAILAAAQDVVRQMNVQNVKIRIIDQGALDCVVRARVETALMRGMEA